MTTFEPFDIVEVPFPFIDAPVRKVRPALVLSFPEFNQTNAAIILAMVTSTGRASWHHDVALEAWQEAGLRKPSIVRWKVFTLETALVLGKRGHLAQHDQKAVRNALRNVFGL